MKKKKLIIPGLIVVIASLSCVAFMGQGLETEVITATPHKVTDTFTEDGIVKQGDSVQILSNVNGEVTEVFVSKNAYINKGDTIAKINPKNYNYEMQAHESTIKAYKAQIDEAVHSEEQDKEAMSYSINELNEQLHSLTAGKKVSDIQQLTGNSPEEYLNVLDLNLDVCQNNYALCQKEYEQLQALYDAGAASSNEVEVASNECTNAKATLVKAQTQYDATSSQLENLKKMGISSTELNKQFYALQDEKLSANIASIESQVAALENKLNSDYSTDTVNHLNALIDSENVAINQLKEQVNDCNITATSSGYITDLPVQNLSQVQAGTAIATVKPTEQLTISVDILTSCEPYLKVGDPVVLTQKLKSEDIIFSGTIQEIYDFATESTSALGLSEYRVQVIITPDDTTISLKDGYELEVTFTTFANDQALSVPNSAIFKIDGKDYIYKLENNIAVQTPVDIAHETNTESVITSGINEGDQIIYNANTENMTNGCRIKPITKS